ALLPKCGRLPPAPLGFVTGLASLGPPWPRPPALQAHGGSPVASPWTATPDHGPQAPAASPLPESGPRCGPSSRPAASASSSPHSWRIPLECPCVRIVSEEEGASSRLAAQPPGVLAVLTARILASDNFDKRTLGGRTMNKRSVARAAIEEGRGSALAIPAQVAETARSYARASRAQSTLRAYRSAWRGFVAWCEAHGFEYLPATPTTVALYATARAEAGIKPGSIDLDLAAIAAAHSAAGYPSPRASAEVQAVRAGIRRTHGTAQRQAAPLLPDDLRSIVAALPDTLA